jgi:DNA-directed RNA polymerase II subunit RPB2
LISCSRLQVRVKFEQIFMSKPMVTEMDGDSQQLFPKEARLRNLT